MGWMVLENFGCLEQLVGRSVLRVGLFFSAATVLAVETGPQGRKIRT